MKKQIIINNNGTLMFYLIKYLKEFAHSMNVDEFSCWYVRKMIIPYCDETGKEFQLSFAKAIGFKDLPTIDKVQQQLQRITLINNK